jgi:hypothetical protein
MTTTKRFYKESDTSWYIDLPEWPGEKAELAMVMGADVLLEILAQGEGEVKVTFADEPFEGAEQMTYYQDGNEIGGAYYHLKSYMGIDYDFTLWLCDVTKFVFGKMPETIYFK